MTETNLLALELWLLYTRQSRGHLKSIEDQDAIGTRLIFSRTGAPPAISRSDGSSAGPGSSRDEWPLVLEDIRAGRVNRVWLWEVSRGSRDLEEWAGFLRLCAEHGCLLYIHTAGRLYDPRDDADWTALAGDGLSAERAWRGIRASVNRGKRGSMQAGLPQGIIPFGIIRLYDPRTRDFLGQEPDEETRVLHELDAATGIFVATGEAWGNPADVVRSAWVDAYDRVSLDEISEGLRERRVPTPRLLAALERPTEKTPQYWIEKGTKWTEQTIRGILLNRQYIGKMRFEGETVTIPNATPVVDPELFYEVRKILKDPRRVTTRPSKVKYLLTCLATCAKVVGAGGEVCGYDLAAGPLSALTGRPTYYRCSSRHGHIGIQLDELDRFVASWFWKYLAAPGRMAALKAYEERTCGEDLARIRAEAAEIESELNEWRALTRARGPLKDHGGKRLRPAAWMKREQDLADELDRLRKAEQESGTLRSVREFDGVDSIAEAAARWKRLARRPGGLTVLREVIRELVRVRVRPAGRGNKFVPCAERVDLVPVIDVD